MGEIVEHIFPRGDVDTDVVPLVGRDLRQTALHQRFARRNDLDDGGMALGQIALDGADQGRRLHAGQEMTEETLLGGFERRSGGGFRSEEHTSELQSLMRISYAVFCLKKKKPTKVQKTN